MADKDLFGKANESFVAENYQEALELYSQAITADGTKDEYFVNRAHTHIKLDQYTDALNDANKALEINPTNPKAYLRKGVACFEQGQFDVAKEAFTEAKKIDSSNTVYETWLQKCDAKLGEKKTIGAGDPKSSAPSSTREAVATTNTSTTVNPPLSSSTSPQMECTAAPAMPSGVKTRYDWYQTESHVIVTVMLKKVKKEDAQIDVNPSSLSATVKLPEGSDYSLELDLAHQVVPEQCQVKILSTKIEIKMKKAEGIRWTKLEGDGEACNVKQFDPADSSSSNAYKYPSSSHYTRDWDKMVADIKRQEKDEKLEGDAALNQLFQQIYSDGSDEVRKAMNKSFVESGGTVLSTNWKDIAKGKVDIKAPDGMEHKTWEY